MPKTKFSLKDIDYRTEVVEKYAVGLRGCKDWKEVKVFVNKWKCIASDAVSYVELCSAKYDWKMCCKLVQKENYTDDELKIVDEISYIFMPAALFMVGLTASQFHVPWGCAYIQLKNAGKIIEKKGIAYILNE